jgi:hypothetical protein
MTDDSLVGRAGQKGPLDTVDENRLYEADPSAMSAVRRPQSETALFLCTLKQISNVSEHILLYKIEGKTTFRSSLWGVWMQTE